MPNDTLRTFHILVSGETLSGDKVRAAFYDCTKDMPPDVAEDAFRVVQRHYPEVADQIRKEFDAAQQG